MALDPQRTTGGSRRFSDEDLDVLRRIQELTADGVNLEGVKRILRLERELDDARREAAALREAVQSSIEATHRQSRRDLVPVQNTIALFVAAQRQRRGGV